MGSRPPSAGGAREPAWGPAIVALLLLALAGCSDGGGGAATANPDSASEIPEPAYDWSQDPWEIVVSLPIFADFAREMGGNQVKVTALIPPGEDPHTYVPDSDAAVAIQTADLVFVNGLGLDQPTLDFIEANRPDRRLFMVDFARDVRSPTADQPIGGRPIYATDAGDNAHLYLDPTLAASYIETISHSLVIIDEINEPYYDALFDRYKAQLLALDESIADQMGAVPTANRTLVTEHDSMVHWANRYGFTIGGSLSEDGAEGIRSLLTSGSTPAVFTETGVGDDTLAGLASDFDTRVCELATHGAAGGDVTYIEMMTSNAETLTSCLAD